MFDNNTSAEMSERWHGKRPLYFVARNRQQDDDRWIVEIANDATLEAASWRGGEDPVR